MGVQWGLPQCSSGSLTLIHESQDILGGQRVLREYVFFVSECEGNITHCQYFKAGFDPEGKQGTEKHCSVFWLPPLWTLPHHPCSNGLLSSFVLLAAYPAVFGSGHGDSSLSALACLIVPSFLVNSIEPLLKMYGHYFQRLSKNTALT